MDHKSRSGKSRKLVITLAIILVIVLLIVCAVAYAMSRMQRGAAITVDKPTPTPVSSASPSSSDTDTPDVTLAPAVESTSVPIYRVAQRREDVTNILLIGTDSRMAGARISGNADTVILASYNRTTQTATLVSFLRDSMLNIGGLDGSVGKLRSAYTEGGVGTLINTLNEYFDLDIQGYVAIGLNGFAVFVDETLGGLTLELNQQEIDFINTRITEYNNEIDLVKNCPTISDPPGMIHLNGAQTLIFVRNRSTSVNGGAENGTDFDRVSRQQEVLKLMYQRIVAEQPLTAVPGLISFALRYVETNLNADDLYRLAVPLMTEPVTIDSLSVPFSDTYTYGGDGSEIYFDRAETSAALHALLYRES